MDSGLWIWPPDTKTQRRVLRKISKSEHLMTGMQALTKSTDGLSNAQIDAALSDYSHWQTRWVVEQLISLGFADYKVDFFGEPGKYVLTELGRNALAFLTGKPAQTPTPDPVPPKPHAAAPTVVQTK